jgi:arylsulfatase A-like enzyme
MKNPGVNGDGTADTVDGTVDLAEAVLAEAQLETAYVGAIRTDEWKYVSHGIDDATYLYDLSTDSNEQCDVSEERPDVLGDLEETLSTHRERPEAVDNGSEAEDDINRSVEGRLKRLGYLE